ncbi:MAG: hypothetical protein KJP21_07715, partial [Bacteroidia bacterium]|nr:hypothetical protein [Bacteroidia bacterium]
MKKTLLLLSIIYGMTAYAQTVTTYAGIANNDAFNNYESSSGVALDNTYFSLPEGICFDPNGKMYISERNKVRTVHNNLLYIRAGSPLSPTSSEGYKNALGTSSTFRNPSGMASDANGNIYVADRANHCIRKIDKFNNLGNGQNVTTFAGTAPTPGLPGNGTPGSANGTGTSASFNSPTGVAIDSDGYLYVTDYNNYTVRKISPSGVVTTLAGSPGVEGTTDGTGSAARFGGPWGVAIYDANHIVVTDQWNCNVRKINKISGATTTLAGPTSGPNSQHADGTLTTARFKVPKGIAVVNGVVYVGDQNTIRAINESSNTVTTFAGDKSSFALTDGNGSNAAFTEISDVTTDGNGNLFVSENSGAIASSVIRKITINDLAPTANFIAPERDLVIDEKIVLSDISTGQAATSRLWTITPTTYDIHTGDLTTETVEISFKVVGFFEVSLEITNDYGTDSKTVDAYFSVSSVGSVERYNASNL